MPIYPFKCQICGTEFDEFFYINEQDKNPVCPACHQQNSIQLLGMTSAWHPHPLVFQNTPARQQAVALEADRMVKNGDDRK